MSLKLVKSYPAVYLYFLSVVLSGTFNEYLSALISVLLLAALTYRLLRNGRLLFKINYTCVITAVICLFYLICSIWAIDRGIALLGFIKYLPLMLFLLLFMQNPSEKAVLFEMLPSFAAITTIISTILMQIPELRGFFSVAGRLSGFFQYSNTFALFELVCFILAVTKPVLAIFDYLKMAVIIVGIFYSGSRSVMVLTIVCIVVLLIFISNRRLKISVISIFSVLMLSAVVYALVSGNFDTIGRFLKTSFTESTFLGRLLYYKDGIRVIATHPFGIGYLGYYFCEQSIQTGLYSVRYIHNDFLQLFLDIGWFPAIGFIFVILRAFFSKGAGLKKRLMIFAITAHVCFDFDLQFISVFLLFILILDDEKGKIFELKNKVATASVLIALALMQLYFGIALFLSYIGMNKNSLMLYPYNTLAQIELLTEEINIDQMNNIADDILSRNEYIALAYSAKARYAYSNGNFEDVIAYKKKVFKYAPYQIEDYNEYCRMLIIGIQLYEQSGDSFSAEYCFKELQKVPEMLERVKNRTDSLAFLLTDKPELELEPEITTWTEKYESGAEE